MTQRMSVNETVELEAVGFETAISTGEVLDKSGYHQPNARGYQGRGCGCRNTTRKGAYRDVSVRMPDGRTIHYYHQSPVVVECEGRYRLSSCGYRTSTTKKRINRYIPGRVYQENYTWYYSRGDKTVEFSDGMVVEG